MLVGEHGGPLGVGEKIDDTDLFEKPDRFGKQDPDDARRGQHGQEAAAEQQPLDQRFLELKDIIFL